MTPRTTIAHPGIRAIISAPITAALALSVATAPIAAGAIPTTAYAAPQVQTQAEATPDKAETVWVYADPTGAARSVEVDVTIANRQGSTRVEDVTRLSDLSPTSTSTALAAQDGTRLTWDSPGGDDISYEGASHDQPPVSLRVTYLLDGKEVTPSQLVGATGRVTIRYDYLNESSALYRVAGRDERIYTPFLAVTALSLDPERFSNASVTNGRIMEEAGSLVVVGYALPGLAESLGDDLALGDLEIPSHFELSADVTDFELGKTLTMVSTGLLDDLDSGELDLGEISEAMDAMHEAVGALGDGAGQLTSGLGQLAQGAQALEGGLGQFAGSLGDAATGAQALAGAGSQLTSMVDQVEQGAGQAAQGADALVDGMEQLRDGTQGAAQAAGQLADGIAGAGTGVAAARDGVEALAAGVVAQRDAALDAIDAATEQARAAQDSLDADALSQAAGSAREAASGFEAARDEASSAASSIQAAQDALDAIDTADMPPVQAAQVEAARERLAATSVDALQSYGDQAQAAAGALDEAAAKLDDASQRLLGVTSSLGEARDAVEAIDPDASAITGALDATSTALDATSQGAGALKGGLEQSAAALGNQDDPQTLIGGASALGDGLGQLAGGLRQSRGGVADLANALSQLGAALPQAAAGAAQLHEGSSALATGLDAAAQGGSALEDGLAQFDEEGVMRLSDELDGRFGAFGDRADALSQASRAYDNFGGIAPGQTGSVRFVYQVDSIGRE